MRLCPLFVFPLFLLCFAQLSFAETTFFGPVRPYLSVDDTPDAFYCRLCDECVSVLEDFEDDSIDHGIRIDAIDGRIIGPDFGTGLEGLTDSVDGDDGAVDGVGNEAHSYFSPGNTVTITFADPVKSAGVAWTDGDRVASTTVEFFGVNGSLGTIGPSFLADNEYQGSTAEDAFFGAQDADGITSIVVTNIGGSGIEIDHVQFEDCSACSAVPEPSSLLSLAVGLFVLPMCRRRARREA